MNSIPLTKTCSQCGEEKPLNEFHKQQSGLYGRRSICRHCRAIERGSNPKNYRPPKPEDIPDGHKLCGHCRSILPATPQYFDRNGSTVDGLSATCKVCKADGAALYVYTPRPDVLKTCSVCGQGYPSTAEYFTRNKRHNGGLHSICKQCKTVSDKQYRLVNLDEIRAHNKIYRIKHAAKYRQKTKDWRDKNPERARQNDLRKARTERSKRRARKLNLPCNFGVQDWDYALNYFNGCCAVCGRPPGFWHTIAADHWIPLTSSNCPGTITTNIVPLCHGQGGCNNIKANKDPETWLIEQYGERKARKIIASINLFFDTVRK